MSGERQREQMAISETQVRDDGGANLQLEEENWEMNKGSGLKAELSWFLDGLDVMYEKPGEESRITPCFFFLYFFFFLNSEIEEVAISWVEGGCRKCGVGGLGI